MSAQGISPVLADKGGGVIRLALPLPSFMRVESRYRHRAACGQSRLFPPEKEWLFQQKVSMRKLTSVTLTKIALWSTFRLFKWF